MPPTAASRRLPRSKTEPTRAKKSHAGYPRVRKWRGRQPRSREVSRPLPTRVNRIGGAEKSRCGYPRVVRKHRTPASYPRVNRIGGARRSRCAYPQVNASHAGYPGVSCPRSSPRAVRRLPASKSTPHAGYPGGVRCPRCSSQSQSHEGNVRSAFSGSTTPTHELNT